MIHLLCAKLNKDCHDHFSDCMRIYRNLDKCMNLTCSGRCKFMKCRGEPCTSAAIPVSCLNVDKGVYFNKHMCNDDLKKLCADPDITRTLCDHTGPFSKDGKTPCCNICGGVTQTPDCVYRTPVYYPQPLGTKGWGYRDPTSTYYRLIREETRPMMWMPATPAPKPDIVDMSVDTAHVDKKGSCFAIPELRPIPPAIEQRPQATSPYANWASTLQP